jgi:small GTP-binding protein
VTAAVGLAARHPTTGRPTSYKIVVTGPFDAGKTTLIRTIAQGAVVQTERAVSRFDGAHDGHSGGTTVAMDFGRVAVADGLSLHLFGTPGQPRFEFMWDILAEGMLGLVLVADGSRPASWREARQHLDHFGAHRGIPLVVAANKVPADDPELPEACRTGLGLPAGTPVLAVDLRERADVKRVLLALLQLVRAKAAGTAPAVAP